MKTHRFNQYGPVCGAADGVNAADMDPPEITCRRCIRTRTIDYWEGNFGFAYFRSGALVERRDGRFYVAQAVAA